MIFDSDPAPLGRPVATAMEEMSQAMIRGVMDESGEQFVAYFLPTEDTIKKRKRDVEDEVRSAPAHTGTTHRNARGKLLQPP